MQGISPCLWFDGRAEEAMDFYVSVFPNSRVVSVGRNGDDGPGPAGSVLMATFELDGRPFMALNGGPMFTITEAVSFFVSCDTQEEVDYYWSRLSEGGQEQQCGWLKDRFGVSWQIVPVVLGELLGDADGAKAGRVMSAMLAMRKIDIAALRAAHDGAG